MKIEELRNMIREELENIFEGKYDYNNLDNANSFYKVKKAFTVWIEGGYGSEPAGYYGSSAIYKMKWNKVKASPGDEVHNLHGGLFFQGTASKNKRVRCKASPPSDRIPFERGRDYEKFPLDRLERYK